MLAQAKINTCAFLSLMFLARPNFLMRANLSQLLALVLACTASSGADVVRPMRTDRPDVTESGYSVAPGFFQVEMSFFDYERDRAGPDRLDSWIYGQINFKYGLTTNNDIQVVFDTHTVNRAIGADDEREITSGFGDVTLRLKHNLWGNDSGRSALSVMPFITMPTGSELSAEAWAGGVVMPFAMTLNDRFSLGSMGQVDLVPDGETHGHDLEFLATVCLGLTLTERWGTYSELIISAGEDTDAQLRSATGVTFAVTDDFVLDAGVRIGLNRAAPDLGVFSGVSFRF